MATSEKQFSAPRLTNIAWMALKNQTVVAFRNIDGTFTEHVYVIGSEREDGVWAAFAENENNCIFTGSLAACLEACEDNERVTRPS